MGCSLLSIMEIFYFLANGSSSMFSKCKAQKSPQVWATKSTTIEPNSKSIIDGDILSALNKLTIAVKDNEKQTKELREEINGLREEVFQRFDNL
jgi:hypothetical protein